MGKIILIAQCWLRLGQHFEAEFWSRFWGWGLVEIQKLNFDQGRCKKLCHDPKAVTLMKALNPWVHFSFGTVYAEVWPRFQNCNYVHNLQPYWNTYWLKNLTLDPNVLVVLRSIFVRKKNYFFFFSKDGFPWTTPPQRQMFTRHPVHIFPATSRICYFVLEGLVCSRGI